MRHKVCSGSFYFDIVLVTLWSKLTDWRRALILTSFKSTGISVVIIIRDSNGKCFLLHLQLVLVPDK